MRLSLSPKVTLTVVLLPVLLQCAGLGWLLSVQLQSQRELARAMHAAEVLDALGQARIDMYSTLMHLSSVSYAKEPFEGTAHYAVPLSMTYTRLLRMTRGDPTLHAAVEKSKHEANLGISCLLDIVKDMKASPYDNNPRHKMWDDARMHMYNVLSNNVTGLATREFDLADSAPLAQEQYQRQAFLILIAFALASTGMALTITALLTRGITMRISKISDNARRLAKETPLHRPLAGDDEIARLDNTFHKMARILQQARARKRDMLVMATHDLLTPLNNIGATLASIGDGTLGALDAKGKEYVQVGTRNVDRMVNMVGDLLDIESVKSGLMTLNKKPFNLDRSIEGACELCGALAEKSQVRLAPVKCQLVVNADADRVTRVIANLVGNAIKYSPAGGTVSISAKRDADWIYTRVTDQGPGIAKDQLEKIFERFHQADDRRDQAKGGSGLGLTICRAIVELHGGKIWAESTPGEGSAFIFKLPASMAPLAQAGRAKSPQQEKNH